MRYILGAEEPLQSRCYGVFVEWNLRVFEEIFVQVFQEIEVFV
jgi:hypothetical protein